MKPARPPRNAKRTKTPCPAFRTSSPAIMWCTRATASACTQASSGWKCRVPPKITSKCSIPAPTCCMCPSPSWTCFPATPPLAMKKKSSWPSWAVPSGSAPAPRSKRPPRRWPRSSLSSTPAVDRHRAPRSRRTATGRAILRPALSTTRPTTSSTPRRRSKRIWKKPTPWTACSAATWAWAKRKWPCGPRSSA